VKKLAWLNFSSVDEMPRSRGPSYKKIAFGTKRSACGDDLLRRKGGHGTTSAEECGTHHFVQGDHLWSHEG